MSKKSRRKNKGSPGFNSQGLRDLNNIPAGPSKGIVLELPPDQDACEHIKTKYDDIFEVCLDCGKIVREV